MILLLRPLHPLVQLVFDRLQVFLGEGLGEGLGVDFHVEVGREVVHVQGDRVRVRGDTEHTDDRRLQVRLSVLYVHWRH